MAVSPKLLLPFLLLAAAPVSCGDGKSPLNPLEERRIPADILDDATSVVASNNHFAVDLYAALRGSPGNLFLSPYSVSTALAMTYAGAQGTTEAEMAHVLHFDLPQDRLHRAFAALQASLTRGAELGGYELSIANRLWGMAGFPFLDAFLATTREQYGAALQPLDFAGAPEDARRTINDWVAAQTKNRIQNLLPAGTVTEWTRLVLTNAIYFKGLWETPFDRAMTRTEAFHVDASHTVSVPMMRIRGMFAYGNAGPVGVLEMPYQGKDLSMFILLPATVDGLPGLESGLTKDALDGMVGSVQPMEIDVEIPRFRVTDQFSLNGQLAALGMPTAFAPDSADFSGMDGRRDLFLSYVIHKAFVDVNEEGTEAAAATAGGMATSSIPAPFTADHPFLFLIRDNVTGSILFLGRLADPSA